MNVFKEKKRSQETPGTVQRLQYGVQEAAQMLGFSERKLYDLIAKKTIHSYKIGGRRFISSEALVAFVQAEGGSNGSVAS